MANILGVTNPVPGYENVNRNLPISPNDPQIQNVPDPSRVGRPDARTDQEDAGTLADPQRARYDSNFQAFLQRLSEDNSLAQSLSKLFMRQNGTLVLSGLGPGTAAELAKVLEMLHMDREQLLRFLSGQFRSGTRFGGALFALLRNTLSRAGAEGVQTDILRFLKCYADYSSTAHLESNLLRNLEWMADSIPQSWGQKLQELAAQLAKGIAAGDREGNLNLLKGGVFPFMSEYVERTHDIGLARGLLTLMALDIARYENGTEQNLLQTFRQLSGYPELRSKLGGIDERALMALLNNSEYIKSARSNEFADHLAAAAAHALRGEGGAEAQEIFREIVSAMLINESVYMPLNHLLLPMEWDGRMLFSELWVDPDDQSGREREGQGGGRITKVLFKMDVQGLGLFDIVLVSRESSVSVQIFCPERIAPFSKQIEQAVAEILTRNELKLDQIQVRQMLRPLSLTEVFPKIFEGRDSVNVKV